MGESLSKCLCPQNELGKGAFQELDQVKAVQQFCKYAGSASSAKDIVPTITAALKVNPPLHPAPTRWLSPAPSPTPPPSFAQTLTILLCAACLALVACLCSC